MFNLSNLPQTVQKKVRRIGRGPGSSKGKNAGHGHKGQIKRKGGTKSSVGFEGGQNSIIKRIPKYRGYNNKGKANLDLSILTTGLLDRVFEDNAEVSVKSLLEKGLVTDKIKRVRIIRNGKTDKKFTFSDEVYLTSGVKKMFSIQ